MDLIQKLLAMEKSIAAEKGEFILFAVLQRADSIGLWDLLLSASWFEKDERKTLDFIVEKLKNTLTPPEILQISRILLIPSNDPLIQQIRERVPQPVSHGNIQISSWTLSNTPVSNAHIITATGSLNRS